jgi:LuxR family maltose regulon positive regulatory protein
MLISALQAVKLRPPALPQKRVARPQLAARLTDGWEEGRRVTLVSAPAGFGKTTCVLEWLETLKAPAAWLSLEAADDDPGRFFSYFVAALQGVDENIGREIAGVLQAGQLPPEEILVTTLGNDILEIERRFPLVLDDFHAIQDPFILRVLERLIAGPLDPLHLVLLTREDPSLPLARLRAGGGLTEIRATDLRFDRAEAESFLNGVMDLSLGESEIDALEERTEGWPVGLHLAALSIKDRSDPSRIIASMGGGRRYILNYLAEEVLNRQTEETRRFLLQTSILEKLSGGLCDSITGGKDGAAELERLHRANLFLVPLDEERRWYRYHALFADLLRDRTAALPKEEVAGWHRRAGGWYERADFPDEAIRHYLSAAEYADAVRLIEAHAMDLVMRWHIKTVDGWMRSIPPEWFEQSIRANLAFLWMLMIRREYERLRMHLQRLQKLFSESQTGEASDPSLRAKWLALQAMMLSARHRPEESLRLAEEARTIAPAGDFPTLCMVHLALAGAYEAMEDYDRAAEAYQRIIRDSRRRENSAYELLGVTGLGLLAVTHGKLHFAHEIAAQAVDRMQRAGVLSPAGQAVYGELGSVCYSWHRLEDAHREFRRAIQVSAVSGFSDSKLYYGVVLSRLHQMEGKLEEAEREILEAARLMQSVAALVVREEVIAQQARVYLAQGRLPEAEALLAAEGFSFAGGFSCGEKTANAVNPRSWAALSAVALRILLHRVLAGRKGTEAESGVALADRLAGDALRNGYVPFAVEILLLRAQLLSATGSEAQGRADYQKALELAEPERMISAFIEEGPPAREALMGLLTDGKLSDAQRTFCGTVLAAFAESGMAKTEGAADPLTEREREVLRLIAEGLRYEEVAGRLVVSLNTVRSHVKAIYGKLGVNNRTRAIETAHRMKIL